MKRRDWLMLGVTISFLILSPSIFSCTVATVPPEDEPKTSSSFLDDRQEGTWWADTNIHPGDHKPVLHISELLRRIELLTLSKEESADVVTLVYIWELEEALALNRVSEVASTLDRLSTDSNLGSEVASTLDWLSTESTLMGSQVASSPLVRSTRTRTRSELEELASDDPPQRSLCESEPDRRESEEAEATRDSDDLVRASDDSTWGSRTTESPLSSASTLHIPEWILACPLSRETEEVALASTTTTRDCGELELAVDSTGHSSTPDSSPTPSSIPQSSDLASVSTPHSEPELACHTLSHNNDLNIQISDPEEEAALTLSRDYHAIRIDPEQVASFRNPILIGRRGQVQVQHLGRAVLEYVVPVILELFAQNPRPSPASVNLVTIIRSNSNGYDQVGIPIRSTIAQVYRNEDLGRDVLGYVVPVTLGMLAMNTRPSPTVVNLVLILTAVGFTAIWNGRLLRNAFPRFANRMEQFGVAHVLASFFGLLSTYLPPSLAWLPWLCWALAIAPFTLTFSTDHQSHTASGPE